MKIKPDNVLKGEILDIGGGGGNRADKRNIWSHGI